MTDSWDDEREELEETEEPNLLGHDPVLGPSDPEADFHGDRLAGKEEPEVDDE
jgi:hypothetical protein